MIFNDDVAFYLKSNRSPNTTIASRLVNIFFFLNLHLKGFYRSYAEVNGRTPGCVVFFSEYIFLSISETKHQAHLSPLLSFKSFTTKIGSFFFFFFFFLPQLCSLTAGRRHPMQSSYNNFITSSPLTPPKQ